MENETEQKKNIPYVKKARKTVNSNFNPFEVGKLPPQAPDLEEAVLGALLIEKNALIQVVDMLVPEAFYVEAHSKIYKAILELWKERQPIDILTVTNQLKKSGELEIIGGAYYISKLTNRVASSANVEYYSRIVLQKYIQRMLIQTSTQTIREAYEDSTDVLELLDKAERELFAIAENNIKRNYSSMSELLQEAIRQIEKARDQEDGISGIPSGFTALDKVTAGWQRSDLIILAARPGMGKTAFVLALARNAAIDFKKPVAFFSLEMSSVQLVTRLISGETGLKADLLKRGQLEDHQWQQLHTQITKLADAPLFIDDTPALNVFDLRAKLRRLKSEHNIELAIIDYLQLMTAGNEGRGNREQEVSTISRSLKAIAKELNIPVIVLSQLNRQVEVRGGANNSKRPQLGDLRESGAIEQDADMVMFIYRPDYYQINQDAEGRDLRGLAQIIIAKHRNGSLEDVDLRFVSENAKFTDYEPNLDFLSSGIDPNVDFDTQGAPRITFNSKINEMGDDELEPW
ncbi:MAG: replicative DNA helicase [Bacteroidia bacterium]|nr:replicative DNA helicase [Bacteroidia bacterium]MCZ2248929.1 replicative DNA helicase [Bacteroidia bacterium]